MNCLGLLSSGHHNTDSLSRSSTLSHSANTSSRKNHHRRTPEDKISSSYESSGGSFHSPDGAVATVGVQPMRRIVCEEENPYSTADLFQETLSQPPSLQFQDVNPKLSKLGKGTAPRPRRHQYLSLYSSLPGPSPPQVVEVIVPPSPQFPNSPSVPLSQVDSLFQEEPRYEGDDDFNYAADDDTSYEDEPGLDDDMVYSYFSEVSWP